MMKKAVVFALLLAGCASAPKIPGGLGKGYCFQWGGIEKKAEKAEYRCDKPHPEHDILTCTREFMHKGRHHAHGRRDCYLVWK